MQCELTDQQWMHGVSRNKNHRKTEHHHHHRRRHHRHHHHRIQHKQVKAQHKVKTTPPATNQEPIGIHHSDIATWTIREYCSHLIYMEYHLRLCQITSTI